MTYKVHLLLWLREQFVPFEVSILLWLQLIICKVFVFFSKCGRIYFLGAHCCGFLLFSLAHIAIVLMVKQQCFTSLSAVIPVKNPGHFLKAFNNDFMINSISQILQWNGGRLTSTWSPHSRPRKSPSSRTLFRVLKVLTVFADFLKQFPYHPQWWSDTFFKIVSIRK